MQKQLAIGIIRQLNKTETANSVDNWARKLRGWDKCKKHYRDNVPYLAIVTVLNEYLSKERYVSVEQLKRDHIQGINNREREERRISAAKDIDQSQIENAIEASDDELKRAILNAWSVETSSEAALRIADRIREGKAQNIFAPFTDPLDEVYVKYKTNTAILTQIWGVVEAVSRACVIPGTEYKEGQHQEVATNLAWILRIQLLLKQDLPLSGLHSVDGLELNDKHTWCLTTDGISPSSNPFQRVWELTNLLGKRFDGPLYQTPPSLTEEDPQPFENYCAKLNVRIGAHSMARTLFFHLMEKPESKEVLSLLYRFFPDLMSFVSSEVGEPSEGLLIDSALPLDYWLATWLYRTRKFETDFTNQEISHSNPTQENNNMTSARSNTSPVSVTGSNANVTVVNHLGDGSTTTVQSGITPERLNSLLDDLYSATGQISPRTHPLRREVRELQDEIEGSNTVPSNLMERLETAAKGLMLSDNVSTILNNIRQLWQASFGAGV